MKIKVLCILLSLCFLGLTACKPSYPRDSVPQAVQKIIKKEYNLDGKATLSGETLYLEVRLNGLLTTDPKRLGGLMKKVQGAVIAVTRVSLSSDARIKYMVVSTRDSSWRLGLRIIQRVEDVKGYLYQRISRSDYEDRLILEIDSSTGTVSGLYGADGRSGDLKNQEFLGRRQPVRLRGRQRHAVFRARGRPAHTHHPHHR
jgi:hypothetical protein